jgi:hypothetical protein
MSDAKKKPAEPAKPVEEVVVEGVSEEVKAPKSEIDESIQIALAAAGTATDAAMEIQRLRKQVNDLVSGSRRTSTTLVSAGVFFLFCASVGLGIAVMFFFQAMNRFDSITNVNREALVAFAEEVNAFTAAATRVEGAATATEKKISALMAQGDELKAALGHVVQGQEAVAAKLVENSGAIDKIPPATQKIVDDLVGVNKLALAQLGEALKAQQASVLAANPQIDIAKQLEEIVKGQLAIKAREERIAERQRPKAAPRPINPESMIKFP